MSLLKDITELNQAQKAWPLTMAGLKHTPFILTVINNVFDINGSANSEEELHEAMRTAALELDSHGIDVPIPLSERPLTLDHVAAFCRSLCVADHTTHTPWFTRGHDTSSGTITYELTAEALSTRQIFESAIVSETKLSESNMLTVIESIDRATLLASDNITLHLKIINEKIEKLQNDREALLQNGIHSDQNTKDQIVSTYQLINSIVRDFPREFRTLANDIISMRADLISDFRNATQSHGQIIFNHYEAIDLRMKESSNGRTFTGVMEIFRDESLMSELKEKLSIIAKHEALADLSKSERNRFIALTQTLSNGSEGVMFAKRDTTRIINQYVGRATETDRSEILHTMDALDDAIYSMIEMKHLNDEITNDLMPRTFTRTHAVSQKFNELVPPKIMTSAKAVDNDLAEAESQPTKQTRQVDFATLIPQAVLNPTNITHHTVASFFNSLPEEDRHMATLTSLLGYLHHVETATTHDDETEIITVINPESKTHEYFNITRITWQQ